MECVEGVFRGTRVGSSDDGEISSLVGVEGDGNGVGTVRTLEDKGVDATIMIERVCKEVRIDGVVFEVNVAMRCNEEMIASLVCVFHELVRKCGPGYG